jgi:hypothetical protein
MNTMKCELSVSVSILGEGKDRKSVCVLKFGPVVVGSNTMVGRWAPEQVLRDLRMNGAGKWKLQGEGATILRSQGIRV